MNFNELYRKKDRIRPKRTAEERRNIAKILLVGLAAMGVGILVAAIGLLVYGL